MVIIIAHFSYHYKLMQMCIRDSYLTPYMMDLTGLPPTFVTVGEHDFLYIECMAYAKKLVKAGVETTTVVYKGMGHAYGCLLYTSRCV